jgi:hypothetical protein
VDGGGLVVVGASALDLPPFELDADEEGVELKSGDGVGVGGVDGDVEGYAEVEVEGEGQRKVPECWGHRGGSQDYRGWLFLFSFFFGLSLFRVPFSDWDMAKKKKKKKERQNRRSD